MSLSHSLLLLDFMILNPAVDSIVKVVDINAVPGAIVMDSIDERLTTTYSHILCTIWSNPTTRLLLACLPVILAKLLNSWVCCAFLCFHVTQAAVARDNKGAVQLLLKKGFVSTCCVFSKSYTNLIQGRTHGNRGRSEASKENCR